MTIDDQIKELRAKIENVSYDLAAEDQGDVFYAASQILGRDIDTGPTGDSDDHEYWIVENLIVTATHLRGADDALNRALANFLQMRKE